MSRELSLLAGIDRFELDEKGQRLAVLVFDDGQQLVVPEELLPSGARPQQVVRVEFHLEPQETTRRADEIERLQRDLFGD